MTAYLAGFFATVSISLGALIFLMVGILSRATWLTPIRRVVEAMSMTLPVFLVLYVPIALGLRSIYPWADPSLHFEPAIRASLDHAHVWYAPGFFVVRSYVYLLSWCAMAFALRRASLMQDADGVSRAARMRALSAGGLPLVAITASFAGFDWLMSLQPAWTSDAFGLYVAAGCFAGALGALCVILYVARATEFLARSTIRPDHVHAVGRVMLVAVMLWAYVGFCQFLLIWIANLPSEIPFYADRWVGSWMWVFILLVLLGFILPFLLLLSRTLKRNLLATAVIGGLVLFAHVLDVLWIVMPSEHRGLKITDPLPTLGMLAILAFLVRWHCRAVPGLPVHDPDLARGLEYESP